MALPQKVVEQLGREPVNTPGWSTGLLMFTGGILVILLGIYFALLQVYGPYLTKQTAQLNDQLNALAKTISPDDQAKFIAFYSEIANLKTVLTNHVFASHLFTWLESNTEANVYYSSFSFSTGNKVILTVVAPTETDIAQQLAIFENAPAVKNVSFSTVSYVSSSNTWQFTVTLTMDPDIVFH